VEKLIESIRKRGYFVCHGLFSMHMTSSYIFPEIFNAHRPICIHYGVMTILFTDYAKNSTCFLICLRIYSATSVVALIKLITIAAQRNLEINLTKYARLTVKTNT